MLRGMFSLGTSGTFSFTVPLSNSNKDIFLDIKGIVSLISSDPGCKDVNARFTTVPFKPLSDQ